MENDELETRWSIVAQKATRVPSEWEQSLAGSVAFSSFRVKQDRQANPEIEISPEVQNGE